jgi:putative ABC transport system permease protein
MFRNYFKIAYRNLIRNKLYSTISVFGLAIGIACCLLIYLYVSHEMSFDRFHANADNIYRLIHFEGETGEFPDGTESTSAMLQPALQETFHEVKWSTRVSGAQMVVTRGEKSFAESVVHVDPDFFQMFSFPLILGDAASVLNNPGSVVITHEMAEKYFGDTDPIGGELLIQMGETSQEFLVSGVIEASPANSSIQYSLLVSTDLLKYTIPEDLLQSWGIILFSTYVQLKPGTDIPSFESRVAGHIAGLAKEDIGESTIVYRLQSLVDIHLDPRYSGETVPSSNPLYSYILSAIALAVLLIACINFMTLSIGRSSSRSREVGLRKVLGAQRIQIMRQFWGEALLLSLAALVMGIVLAEIFLPTFNNMAQKELFLPLFSELQILPVLALLALVTAFLAGIYPAMLLSRFLPVDSLRGTQIIGGKNRLIQTLMVLQFAISIFLIISTFVISSQMNYVNKVDLGYDKNLVVTFPTSTEGEEAVNLLTRFRNDLSEQSSIVDITGYSYGLSQSWLYINYGGEEGFIVLIGEDVTGPGYASSAGETETYFYVNWIDEHYIPTMEINLTEGRNFSESNTSDQDGAIIVNRTLVDMLGWENPIGQKLPKGFGNATVIGVVEDFHYYPLHRKIEPLVFHMPRNNNLNSVYEIAVRLRGENISSTLSLLERTWTRVSDGMPFAYEFLDERVAGQYFAEDRWRDIVQYSSIFSFLVACLGLFGLTSLAVAKRTREVGIRKVLGASVAGIVMMFSRDFTRLILIANVIAWPAAYFVMDHWLDNFAYRTGINISLFILTAVIALGIALLTMALQAIKAAFANPVEAIKYE